MITCTYVRVHTSQTGQMRSVTSKLLFSGEFSFQEAMELHIYVFIWTNRVTFSPYEYE